MPEDPLRLREELAQIKKDIAQALHIKEAVNNHIENLHKEELKYIADIPAFKQQAKDAEAMAGESYRLLNIANDKLKVANEELNRVSALVSQEHKALIDLRATQEGIIKDGKDVTEQARQREEKARLREVAVQEREKKADDREQSLINRDENIFKDESDLQRRKQEHSFKSDELQKDIDAYTANVAAHEGNVAVLAEQKRFYTQDEQTLRDKLGKADKLVKDHVELKASLLLQSDRLSKSTLESENMKKLLNKNIADLKNQENTLKIKELRVNKLIRDNGLQKELDELEKTA